MNLRLIILTALQAERRAIEPLLKNQAIEFHVVGPCARRLPQGLSSETVGGVVMAGLAGALDPDLKIGDVVIDLLSQLADGAVPFPLGAIRTSDKIVATPEEKAAL